MTTAAVPNRDEVTFEQFCEEWLREITENDLSPFAKGQTFAFKLVRDWLDVPEDDQDLVLCDGSGDGGIDIAYLRRSTASDVEQDERFDEGDTWYLIQSKYGTAFQGQETIVSEGRKVIATLTGENQHLSQASSQLMGRLNTFIEQASERDKLILVFATSEPMNENDRRALVDIRTLGRQRVSRIFDVADVSLQTIWEAKPTNEPPGISLAIQGQFIEPSAGLRVGTIPLINLYQFLKAYREKTGNLDQLYEKNVRRFLGSGGRVNKGVAKTLNEAPEMFGLYNNGITLVVSDFQAKPDGSLVLYNPYVVNGCQTTKSIWNVLEQKLDAGGTGEGEANADWRTKADLGVVVTKIVKEGKEGAADLTNITRFTNSQNAVSERDFLALNDDFQDWAKNMADSYKIFLEIQRGGWDSQKVFQKHNPSTPQFTESVYAFDLLKVYGAGWLRWPGRAYRQTTPFLPGGPVWKEIMEPEPIGVDDLYAAYRLRILADQFHFGRSAQHLSRRQTRFLYYFVVMDVLRGVCIRNKLDDSEKGLTAALIALLGDGNKEVLQLLLTASIEVIDEYINEESDDSVFKEKGYEDDLSNWLKLEGLGQNQDTAARLNSLLNDHKRVFGRPRQGEPSPRDLVAEAVSRGTG